MDKEILGKYNRIDGVTLTGKDGSKFVTFLLTGDNVDHEFEVDLSQEGTWFNEDPIEDRKTVCEVSTIKDVVDFAKGIHMAENFYTADHFYDVLLVGGGKDMAIMHDLEFAWDESDMEPAPLRDPEIMERFDNVQNAISEIYNFIQTLDNSGDLSKFSNQEIEFPVSGGSDFAKAMWCGKNIDTVLSIQFGKNGDVLNINCVDADHTKMCYLIQQVDGHLLRAAEEHFHTQKLAEYTQAELSDEGRDDI